MLLKLQRNGSQLRFNNGYWCVVHDLDRGGTITDVRFLKRGNANFLAAPIEVRAGRYRSLRLVRQRVALRRTDRGYLLALEGRLTDSSGATGPHYRVEYDYSPACIRVRHSLWGASGPVTVWAVAFARDCGWVEVWRPMFGAAQPAHWSRVPGRGSIHALRDAPYSWGGYASDGAGIQFVMTEVPAWWSADTSRFTAGADRDAVRLESAQQAGGGKQTWSFIMAPTSFGRGEAYKYREVVICSQPFPSDADLRVLKDQGVNLVRIHEGANWKNDDEDFWMTGVYPPYPRENLREMKRVIATCHRLGLAIYPYFCLSENHPLSEAFLRHAWDWYFKQGPRQYLRWSGPLTDQIWGAPMCSMSGFGRWLTQHIEQIVSEYGFDGYYLDGTGTQVCYNGRHGPLPHTTADSHQRVLEALRRRLPSRLMVLHQVCSYTLNVSQLNEADHLVTFEELGLNRVPRLSDMPPSFRVATACISTAIVPGIFVPRSGEALTPCLYGFAYKPGKEPRPSRKRLQAGIPVFLLEGAVPYTYYFNEELLYAYRTNRDRQTDREGFYALFRALNRVGDSGGEFLPWHRSPYRANHPDVKVAAVRQAGRAILAVANVGRRAAPSVRLTGPGIARPLPVALPPWGYCFIEVRT